MSRLRHAFDRARDEGRAALVGYLTAFDPDRERSLERMLAACDAGLDVLELGVPFSDPTADGPGIQLAMERAREAGATLGGVLELAHALRVRTSTPIVLFSYSNPIVRMGERFAAQAAEAGIDGLLLVDCPPQHAEEFRSPAAAHGMDWVGLAAPTTTPERLAEVAKQTTGFLYAVTLRGVTGAALDAENSDLDAQLAALRRGFNGPVAAGFGIREPAQARSLAQKADGVVVGTALIQAAQEGTSALTSIVRDLRTAVAR